MKKETITNTGAIGGITGIATCPLCVPFFAGLLSSLGLGILIPFVLPVTTVLLLVALYGFFVAYKVHRRRAPLGLFLLGVLLLYVGRYAFGSDPIWVVGGIIIIVAIIKNYRSGKKLTCDTTGKESPTCCNNKNIHS